ncbi:probable Ribosome assembly protein RRB1 [Zygosaccharomyces bailii ISA1307]|nr:probable Ribosome assembly protein RRB1 [Zygosaccharomyces bailii ISA1307]
MSKRSLDNEEQHRVVSAKTDAHGAPQPAVVEEPDIHMGEYEDQYSDEYESEDDIVEIGDDEEIEEEGDDKEYIDRKQIEAQEAVKKDQEDSVQQKEIYLPHMSRPLGPDEVLEADPSVYEMLHNVNLPWPCMTLDVIPDTLGSERRNYPQSLLLATATQASKKKDNELLILKLSQLSKTLVKDDTEDNDEDEDDEDADSDPIIENENISLKDTTNRLKVSPFASHGQEVLTASMSENGEVYIFDVAAQTKAFETPGYQVPKVARRAMHTIRNHGNVEGYGLDWSPLLKTGALLTGDCSGQIYLTQRHTSKWITDKQPFSVSNNESIEDIQWSPTESTVFASCGTDGYIRIWDTRSKKHKPAISTKASTTDVNVISWNEKLSYLLASGDDNGSWGVWDLRQLSPTTSDGVQPVAQYDFHKGPITSICFNPLDDSVIAVASEDNTVTLWDLSVEADDEEIQQQTRDFKELQQIPPQLLFVHWQKDVKDVKWHKQIPGCLLSTGTDGLNVWKTISV